MRKAFAKVAPQLTGKVAIKLHTGEKDGPYIIPRPWVAELVREDLPEATIVETNTYYAGDRDTIEKHRDTIEHNGWTFCLVDITGENGYVEWPVEGGKWFGTMTVGANLEHCDSLLTLTHFKGHAMGGFGGSNKNLGIGCASGKEGKKWIHAQTFNNGTSWGGQWSVANEELMEKITESTKATIDHFGEHIAYINVLRNMSVSCDYEGTVTQPVVASDLGILVSRDICAIDSASVDLVVTMTEAGLVGNRDLVERMTSRHGFRQLSYMHDLAMGNWRYELLDLDNDERPLTLAELVPELIA